MPLPVLDELAAPLDKPVVTTETIDPFGAVTVVVMLPSGFVTTVVVSDDELALELEPALALVPELPLAAVPFAPLALWPVATAGDDTA